MCKLYENNELRLSWDSLMHVLICSWKSHLSRSNTKILMSLLLLHSQRHAAPQYSNNRILIVCYIIITVCQSRHTKHLWLQKTFIFRRSNWKSVLWQASHSTALLWWKCSCAEVGCPTQVPKHNRGVGQGEEGLSPNLVIALCWYLNHERSRREGKAAQMKNYFSLC